MSSSIPYQELMELHKNYQPTCDYLSQLIGKPETQSVWLEMNEDFINFFKELLDPGNGVSGMRVYLGEYRDGATPPGTSDEDYGRKLTVGFVATKQVGGKQIDYPVADAGGTTNLTNLATDGLNVGTLCPPNTCP